MVSSSLTFFAPSFLSSTSSSSSPLSQVSPPSRASRISPSLSATTTASNTCADDPHRTRQIPQRCSTTASLYEILEIPLGSTIQEIKTAYRRLARIFHPDAAQNDSSEEDFIKIHEAYCTLSDPEKRAVYDRRFVHRRRPLVVRGCGLGSYGGNNWETDQCW